MELSKFTTRFLLEASAKHANKYTYPSTIIKSHAKIVITCPIHGAFMQVAKDHLKGKGCAECSGNKKFTTSTYRQRITVQHNNTISFTGEYTNAHTKLLHKHICGHEWYILPCNILQGQNCPVCKVGGFNISKPAILYFIKLNSVFKIGITNRTVRERYNKTDYSHLEILHEYSFESGQDAKDYESRLLRKYYKYKYLGDTPFTDGTSITECFTKNIYLLESFKL